MMAIRNAPAEPEGTPATTSGAEHPAASAPVRVVIVGVGLIGGSLGLAWRRARPDVEVTGVDAPGVLARALERGAIHHGASGDTGLDDAVARADLVVLAAPGPEILALLPRVAARLRPGAHVTDVGSVKGPVVAASARWLPAGAFTGGHPMAGAERGGIDRADALLFENAAWALTPMAGGFTSGAPAPAPADAAAHDDPGALARAVPPLLRALVEATGARPLVLTAERHDRIAAFVSHLPQLVATALAATAGEEAAREPALLALAGGGFRDTTRVAASSYALWRGILGANRAPALDALDAFLGTLAGLRDALAADDDAALARAFEAGARARTAIPASTKGFLTPLADVFLDASDRVGFLHGVTGALAGAELNLRDIELLKVREGSAGTFRLGFGTDAEAYRARAVLEAAGFTARRMDAEPGADAVPESAPEATSDALR